MLVAVLLGSCGDDGPRKGGPLAPSTNEGITGSGIPVRPDQTFNDRHAVLVNKSDTDVVLETIRRVGVSGEILQGRTYVALGTAAHGPVTGAGRGFPPRNYDREDLQRPEGFRVPPSRTRSGRFGAVVMTFGRVRTGHSFGMRGYEVVYRVGKTVYRTELPQAVAVCASRNGRCRPTALLGRKMREASEARDR